MVVVQWSLIEGMITSFVHALTDSNDPDDPDRRNFDSTRSMQKRLDQWKELTKRKIQQEWRRPMFQLIIETRQLADSRDKIVHGTWADEKNATTIGSEAYGSFNWSKPGHRFDWKLDYGSILAVALKIDNLHAAMMDLVFKANGPNPSGEFFTVDTALQRIQIASNGP